VVGVYVRISDDTDGLALGVKRQEADARALAKRRGWKVARVFVDNDVSAYKANVVRPEFEALLQALGDGELDGIVTYDLDRFARQPVDLERALKIYDARPGLVFATVQSDIDLSTPDGRTMARVMVAFANKSSMDTSRRVKRKHLELAQQGVPVGGNRPFGYKADKRRLEPKEAKLIRQAAQDVLAGVGLHTICRRWNEAGVKTTRGNLWQKPVLRNMFLSPRLAGYRVYQGGIARRDDGSPVTGLFPPVLDEATWRAVCAVITDPSRSGPHVHSGGRKYLLSGLARCGSCNRVMYGSANPKFNTFMYVCQNVQCKKRVGVTGPRLDDMITKLVIAYLGERRIEPDAAPWSGEAELERVESRIYELMNAYSAGDLSSEVVFPQVRKLEDQAAKLKAEQSEWFRAQVQRPTDVPDVWPTDIEEQRTIIGGVLSAVLVKRAASTGGNFDPDRVDPVWREAERPAAKPRRRAAARTRAAS
jgi:DNA invertase Pin-like site-specific DNA recombinase